MGKREILQSYIDYGLKLVAVKNKIAVEKWGDHGHDIATVLKNDCAVATGRNSGGLELVDFDLKYDLTGDLMTRYRKLVESHSPDLIKKLTIAATKNKGYHFIYRCDNFEGNLKLAQRETTDLEKKETHAKSVENGKTSLEADRAAKNDKTRVLIETRGEGGYFACFPTSGYGLIQGSLDSVQRITDEERNLLIQCARTFNEYVAEVVTYKPRAKDRAGAFSVTPLDDFNNRGDCVEVLMRNGWTVVKEKGEKVLMKRPGQTDSIHSGDYHKSKNLFSVFSSSTEFEPQKGYSPAAVFAILECDGDYSEAAKRLFAQGFGTSTPSLKKKTEKPSVSKAMLDDDEAVEIENENDPLHFLASSDDLKKYNKSVREGTLEIGKTTGIPRLDEHFVLKRKQFNVVNGIDNVGKSLVLWYLAMLSSMYHGWRWLILSHENEDGQIYKKLCELFLGVPLKKMNEGQLKKAEAWIDNHFKIIKNVEIYSYIEALKMGKIVKEMIGMDGYLIDPYNSLRVDEISNTHEWHYRATSEMRKFTKKRDVTIFLNCHAVTGATRMKDADGNPAPPGKADTEGGTKFASKADDFLTIHRLTQDKDKYKDTQIHVRKVKDTDTGGRPSPFDFPVIIRLEDSCRFVDVDGRDAVAEWWRQRNDAPTATIDFDAPVPMKANTSFLSSQDRKEQQETYNTTGEDAPF